MPESIEAWWERRQRSKGMAVPYAIGTYRSAWARYPMLVRQYHPDLNRDITLSQIPPAADVYLTWQCDAGHLFVATPDEQRGRPGRTRRRSAWCPVCAELAVPRRPPVPARGQAPALAPPTSPAPAPLPASASASAGERPGPPARSAARPAAGSGRPRSGLPHRPGTTKHPVTAGIRPGTAFHSAHAPKPASAVEADLRQRLGARLDVDLTVNAVGVGRPFFERREVWPDIVIGELAVALEYDTVGRFGLEHVGGREDTDRRKDRLLREAGWEVVRIRCRPLLALGPHDIVTSGVTEKLLDQVLETLRGIRGDLIVNAYLR
ncbi:zinc-ribbon domain-containing protein [Herbiconiux daphne]|uniref:Zinc-ribbon domain-containing protein n=1 Tax=Herbiconiux daphne TaxID=2970914 RepID=A0ABT2GWD3_9MICO|nr:zinc-ribbon domain-containing protein [Herbiconiux daphne]MCS5732262.1 zinc-ribbon domain-containing protein [Herbiconiux daphne]